MWTSLAGVTEGNAEQDSEKPKQGGGCLRWFGRLTLVGLVVLAGLLVWLNGSGIRWLGPKVAGYYIGKSGMTGGLRLGGTLLGGIEVYDLDLKGGKGALERLVVKRLETDYRIGEVFKGKFRGISGKGVHVDLRLAPSANKKPPVDFAALGRTLTAARGKILPLNLNLEDVSVTVKRDDARVVELESSDFSHKSGDEVIGLALGRIIDAEGRFTQKQKATLIWDGEKMTLDKLEILPVMGIRDLTVMLPQDGEISAEGMIRIGGAKLRMDVGKEIRDVRLNLIEGEIDFGKLFGGFGMGLPIKGRLTSLALDMKQVFPEWHTAVGTAEVYVEGFSYKGWEVPELSAGLTLDEGKFSAKLAGKALGSNMAVNGGGDFERAKFGTGDFLLKRISGDLRISSAGDALRALEAKLNLVTDFKEFPESEIGGTWAVDLGEGGFGGVEGDLTLKAKQVDTSPIRLKARYDKASNVVTVSELDADGMVLSGTYNPGSREYEGRQVLKDFDSARIVPWLRGASLETPGSSVVSMQWEGSGNLSDGSLRGVITGVNGVWKWNVPKEGETTSPISAKADKITYDWPGAAEVEGLVVETEGQTVKLDAKLANQHLTLGKFNWLDGVEELATGQGELPVPKDFSKWKEFIETDTRPLDLTIHSEKLPLAKLRPWFKGLEQIDDKATGKMDLKIAGSLADPQVDAVVEIRDVSVPGRRELPKTDVTLNIKARDGRAQIFAVALARDYAPATLKAQMAFLPKKWAQDTNSLMAEKIEGTLDLPKIDLSRFQSLIPGVADLGGVTEGKVVIAGTLGEPKVDGKLKLSGGKLRMKGKVIPMLEGISFEMNADLQTVKIKGGVDNLAGGVLKIDGTLQLRNETRDGLGALDVRVKGTALPVARNEFLIMRANADLQIKGTMADARVTGEVGIIDSVFFKDIELIPIGKPFLEPAATSLPRVDKPENLGLMVPSPFAAWTADVVVKTIDPILIRGNLGSGQMDVAVRIGGTLGDPKPNGKVRLRDLVARLPFSTLQVREGFFEFTPETGFDPILDIRGTAEPRPYLVQVYVRGRASDPQLVLTSQPPLPENEIMTLLATGTTSAGLQDSQAASSRALQLLIEELRRGRFLFGKKIRPLLRLLDNVDFSIAETDPYDTNSYSSATLKLSDRWFVSAGLGAQGDQRVLAIWRLRFR